MREILFRGKRQDNGEWVVGSFLRRTNPCIEQFAFADDGVPEPYIYAVDPDTVGQYTELNDRHAKRIFENDIVEFCGGKEQRYLIWWVRETSMLTAIPVDGISFNGYDYWNGHYPQFEYSTFCLMMQDPWGDFRDIRVIGNIHDNPELLNGGSGDDRSKKLPVL